jgi:FixJ family two-component response regulator
VLDDNQGVRESIMSLLESVNLTAHSFRSAEEFIAKRRGVDEIACLICDVRLPGMGGLELQAVLSRNKTTLPIVFISGHGDIKMSVKAMKGGAIDFLPKPFREQDLLDSVRGALSCAQESKDTAVHLRDLLDHYETLSDRERQVMGLICLGQLHKQAAGILEISEVTVKVHRRNLMKKLGTKSLPELVRKSDAITNALGLVKPATAQPTKRRSQVGT